MRELRSDATTVREYVAPSGVVFAVAWSGLVHPDLDLLLGRYAAAHRAAQRRAPSLPGRRNRRVQTEDVVVETCGHMRKLQGRAYAPALLPPGVSVDEIR